MEKDPLTPNHGRSYESIRRSLRKLREIPEHAESNDQLAKQSKQWMKRRHSSEGSFIHITGTGTITEDALFCGKGGIASAGSSQELDELPHCIGQYGDFHTIDWQRDLSRDTYRQKYIARKAKESYRELLKSYYDKLSGWLCSMPFQTGIPGGIYDGKMIEIKGRIPYGAERFEINLIAGFDSSSDRVLHLSIRFDQHCVVRNHREYGRWGPEERQGAFPFSFGREFTLMIATERTKYRIAVNNQHCWDFKHRLRMGRVVSLGMSGTVDVYEIDFIERPNPCLPAYLPTSVVQPTSYINPGRAAYITPARPSLSLCTIQIYHTHILFMVYHNARKGGKLTIPPRAFPFDPGSVAGFIDIGEGWMKDLKEGICPDAFWLNKEQCCWSSNETFYEGDECDQWVSWYRFFKLDYFSTKEYFLSYTLYVLWSLLFALLACSMVKTFAPYASGSGVPEIKTILSGFIMRGYLGKWTLIIKSVGTMLTVSAGLSLGKEGPLVHIVCCLGNIFSYFFPKYGKNEAKKREVLSAAAAAGVSTAFGAPIGGVLFSLEELSYYFPMKTLWRSFFCALVAAFILRSIDPFGTDHMVKFYMNTTRAWILVELLPFMLLGIMGGTIGAVFIKCNIAWSRYKQSSSVGKFPVLEVMVVTLLTALINFPNEFTRVNASDLIRTLFSQCGINDVSILCDYKRNISSTEMHILEAGPGINQSLYLLLLALLWKFTITIFTFGIKVPTGLFIPSLAMGAIMGRIVGVGMQQLAWKYRSSWPFRSACATNENCMAPGLYAMIGAAACLAGVTRMTVSLVVIMFELTGRVDYIVPLMASVVASKWVADAIEREGIYDAHIQINHYPFLDNKHSFRHSTQAVDLVRNAALYKELVSLSQRGMTLQDVENILHRTTHNGFPIVISKEIPYLIGFVLRRDLCLAIEHLKETNPEVTERTTVDFNHRSPENWKDFHSINLSRIVDMAPLTVTVQTPMETVIEMFCKLGLRQLLVTEHGRLLGIITKKDVLNHVQEMEKKTES
ncbi:H(+)/Cl(-) exchange transporter 3 like protein [Argiope bruennichi]|uniref:Chloride channel protein n=1 Tax=Argiope bruennichi TaxID=94029 RepID=A0A8T0EVH2_ARGBR|nr:H(+)/Cl(-) exchange transporter 3 like protein [Argiope bruennichi]